MTTFQIIERNSVMSPDVFGVWQSRRAISSREQHARKRFARARVPEKRRARGAALRVPRWQIDLSAQPSEMARAFTTLHSSLEATDAALAAAQTRLGDFVRVQRRVPGRQRAATFATAPRPEAELNRLLLSAETSAAFGVTDWLRDWKQAIDEFIAFTQQMQQHVLSYAWVDTRVAEARIGITRVTWDGDFETVLASGTIQNSLAHEMALRASLLARQQLLKQFVTVIHAAGELAGLALIAANPVLALPAALRFLKLLLDEARNSQNA
jgi:hypothetical protein